MPCPSSRLLRSENNLDGNLQGCTSGLPRHPSQKPFLLALRRGQRIPRQGDGSWGPAAPRLCPSARTVGSPLCIQGPLCSAEAPTAPMYSLLNAAPALQLVPCLAGVLNILECVTHKTFALVLLTGTVWTGWWGGGTSCLRPGRFRLWGCIVRSRRSP